MKNKPWTFNVNNFFYINFLWGALLIAFIFLFNPSQESRLLNQILWTMLWAFIPINGLLFLAWITLSFVGLIWKADQYKVLLAEKDLMNKQFEDFQQRERKFKGKEIQLNKHEARLAVWEGRLKIEQESWLSAKQEEVKKLAKEKSLGFPWLSEAYADYFALEDQKAASELDNKSHPAPKAADEVRRISKDRRKAEALSRVLKYQLAYYEALFPWLVELKSEDIDDLAITILAGNGSAIIDNDTDDPAIHWLTASEYANLPNETKYQKALDRYWIKKKSKWEVGRDYERYIGFLRESQGAKISYQGIVEGLADLGRDLVVTHDTWIEIVQCKRWSKAKEIHEKHVFQLFGTLTAYKIDHPGVRVEGTLTTTTNLSDRARQFANVLGIRIEENFPFEEYPSIKCNISSPDQEKIYHLPFDQQYDKTFIEPSKGERFVKTVKEAEDLGFRRAYRWHGQG